MKIVECKVPESEAWIIPIGDAHVGDKSFDKDAKKRLTAYINWVKDNPNARVFLNGDIFNVASRASKTSPFETRPEEYLEAAELFAPIKSQIIAANDGNHEHRMVDMFGISPTQHLCRELGVPYCKWSCVVKLQIGERANNNGWYQSYWLYFHHTSGGAGTIGAGLNKVTKLQDMVQGVDVYFGSHNHQKAAGEAVVYVPSFQRNEMLECKVFYVDCGSFMSYGENYPEQKMYRPTAPGAPRVKFLGYSKKRGIEVTIGGL